MIRGDRPAHTTEEIEVTPEMIAAAVSAFDEAMDSDGFLGRVMLRQATEDALQRALKSRQS
jgi:hypothetical protein